MMITMAALRPALGEPSRLRKAALTLLIYAVALGTTVWAWAEYTGPPPQPHLVPYQGALALDGQPVNGPTDITFALYTTLDPEAEPVWMEPHVGEEAVEVFHGQFDVTLGGLEPITDEMLDAAALYVGMQVGDVPLANRQRLLPSLYALRANNGVPRDAVMFFAQDGCPPGWAPYAPAEGRAIIGAHEAGAIAGEVGDALSDREDRTVDHAHGISLTTGRAARESVTGQTCCGWTDGRYVEDTGTDEHRGSHHKHSVSGDSASATLRTSDLLPYLQLKACRKL